MIYRLFNVKEMQSIRWIETKLTQFGEIMAESSGKMEEREDKPIRVGILTASDRCSAGQAEDRSGANLKQLIEEKKLFDGEVSMKEIVPDEVDRIKAVLIDWADNLKLDLIVSTGGTGFTARDVTPEATKAVLERDAMGFTVAMLTGSLNITPLAMLSRLTCGIRKSTLILNLPGSTKGAEECLRFAAVGISHAVDQLRGSKGKMKKSHAKLQAEATETSLPGQIQSGSDESLDNSVEQFEPPTESQESVTVIEPNFNENDTFDSMDQTPLANSTPTHNKQGNSSPVSDCQSKDRSPNGADVNTIRQSSRSFDRVEDTRTDLTQLCYTADQSNSSLPGEPMSIISLVANQNSVLNETSFDKQDKDLTELFQFQNNFSDARTATSACEIQQTSQLTSPQLPSQIVQDILTLPALTNPVLQTEQSAKNQSNTCNVYDFREEHDAKSKTTKSKSNEKVLKAKLHRGAYEGEVTLVNVGPDIKTFLRTHPYVRGIYLNKGKRDVKRRLVSLKRETRAVDVGSWHRGSHIHDRNRLDDYFDLTEEGKERQVKVQKRHARDEYVVNWYMWCPGHGNCQRKCGGFGKCEEGCKGKTHKQDRHNCSVLVNLKMFLSDLTKWRVHISGTHVPPQPNILWEPPDLGQQRISEDTRDIIISVATTKRTTTSHIRDVLVKRPVCSEVQDVPSKKKICRFVSSMKKRRKQKNYKIRDEVCQSQDDSREESVDKHSCVGPDEETQGEVEIQGKGKDSKSSEAPLKIVQNIQAVSDSAQLDESGFVPSATVIKLVDGAGNVLYFGRNIPQGEMASLTGGADAVPPAEFVFPPASVGLAAPAGLVYTAPCDNVDLTSQDQSSSDVPW